MFIHLKITLIKVRLLPILIITLFITEILITYKHYTRSYDHHLYFIILLFNKVFHYHYVRFSVPVTIFVQSFIVIIDSHFCIFQLFSQTYSQRQRCELYLLAIFCTIVSNSITKWITLSVLFWTNTISFDLISVEFPSLLISSNSKRLKYKNLSLNTFAVSNQKVI